MPYANLVDVLILLFLLFYILTHIKDGFVALVGRLFSFVVSLMGAFVLYPSVAAFAGRFVGISPGILDALSFVILFIIFQAVISYLFDLIYFALPSSFHASPVSRLLAVVPAAIDGLIIASLVLLILVVIPALPQVKRPIEESQIGGALVNKVAMAEGYIDRVFGQATEESLGFLTVKPDTGEPVELPFTVEEVSVDEEAEQRMLALVNAERAKHGLQPLVIDRTITTVARAHSTDMWRRGYFAHENPDGQSPFDRMLAGGVVFRAAGENLALARTVERAHQGLMNSPGHRRNILDPTFTRVGIGVISGGVHGKMFTQNFAD